MTHTISGSRLRRLAVTTLILAGLGLFSEQPATSTAASPASAANVTPTAAPTGTGWTVVPSPNPTPLNDFLGGVAAVSSTNAWAVGTAIDTNSIAHTLIEHWNGTVWTIVPSPNPGSFSNSLSGVAAVSPNDVWAVGSATVTRYLAHTLIEHWNGTVWSVIPSPNHGAFSNGLNGVAVVSATNIWAVGFFEDAVSDSHTLVEHWNGTSWSIVPSPNTPSYENGLNSVAVVSATDIWAVGGSANGPLTEHWNGTSWRLVPNSLSSNDTLSSVTAVSPNDAWAVGFMGGTGQTLTVHWNGTSWSVVPSPSPGSYYSSLSGVAAISAHDVWAVGEWTNNGYQHQALLEQWNGTSWTVVPPATGGELSSVSPLSTGIVWAVGQTEPAYQTLIEWTHQG